MLEGDTIGDRRVAGFAWTAAAAANHRSSHLDDRLLFDGEHGLAEPPDRRVPQTSEGPGPFAPMPPDDLPSGRVHCADALDPTLKLRADALLDLPGTAWQPLARVLFAVVHSAGHRVWLTGGSARDLIAGDPLREVRDLDLTGTVPPGRFMDIVYQSMRASRMSEFRMSVTRDSLVCAVTPPRSRQRVFEYRGLTGSGFRFPTVGSRLIEDAWHRDFTFNALLYDPMDHVVVDPSGAGLEDLLGPARRFQPLDHNPNGRTAAKTVVRAMKFALRWEGTQRLDLEPFYVWSKVLPPDLGLTLTRKELSALREVCRRDVDAPVERQRAFAATVPQPGRALLETLIGRV